ncbi:MAG: polysaccharide export protein [Polyangiaceae bacterium]|nr:polysaccharide export protein [Polyangiaceae bacterium]
MKTWAITLGLLATGCATPGEYVWFRQLPADASQASREYVIGAGDIVSIKVLGHDDMNIRQRVRADGRIAILLIGEVEARGKRPSSLKAEIEARLKDYIVSPSVAVNVDEEQPLTVLLLGEVSKPGAYPMENDRSLAHALALGGGLTDYAARNGIFVVRSQPRWMRIRFTYQDICRDTGGAGAFLLHHGDVVEVE